MNFNFHVIVKDEFSQKFLKNVVDTSPATRVYIKLNVTNPIRRERCTAVDVLTDSLMSIV